MRRAPTRPLPRPMSAPKALTVVLRPGDEEAAARALEGLLRDALRRRDASGLRARMAAEGTTAWRAFNGAGEGFPGLTVDVYGHVDDDAQGPWRVLCQTWRELLTVADLAALRRVFPGASYRVRGGAARRMRDLRDVGDARALGTVAEPTPVRDVVGEGEGSAVTGTRTFTELGTEYGYTDPRPPGEDPPLFLDFRPARRRVRALCAEAAAEGAPLTVLNTFAYTGGMGVEAALGGARQVPALP